MSHNINTYNTNAFDVNSNQSVSIGTTQEYLCMRGTTTQTYRPCVTGLAVRIPNGRLINNLSGVTINYDPTYTSHAASYDLSIDGTYLINCQLSFWYNTSGTSDAQSHAIFAGTVSSGVFTQVSDTLTHSQSNIDYAYDELMSAIVVVSGATKRVFAKCISATNIYTVNDTLHKNWAARSNHFTIWKLK
tara:strand:+ start:297 stop:863 length:567 start_codon:yes stop_codon:yes gene_type:complete